jgi:tetratricopeptide (TPR) repeat protein
MSRNNSSRLSRWILPAVVLVWVATTPIVAQIPDEFTNLKVLPKEIGKQELVSMMRDFAGALGVRCNHCHVGESPDSLEGYDFASDEPEPKRVTRAMMKMTGQINRELLPTTGRNNLTRVRCVTCHRGLQDPESLDRLLLTAAEDGGAEAVEAEYTGLRAEYFGTGSYNFSAGTLNSIAETLAQEKGDVEGAIVLMKLNVDVNPDAAYSYLLLGQLYAQSGDIDAAKASIERSLEIEPDNPWAKRLLERVSASE